MFLTVSRQVVLGTLAQILLYQLIQVKPLLLNHQYLVNALLLKPPTLVLFDLGVLVVVVLTMGVLMDW
uniref:Uncharacterized protein n=1 Tax=Arundo donax TaxID=35708 RepID=A0A0A9DKE3_ARUDO